MTAKLSVLVVFASFAFLASASAWAKTQEFCGVRDGTAGNASLMDEKNVETIELARQGDGDALLTQADELVGRKSGVKGETGTQNGKRYCVVAELDKDGMPTKIVKAWFAPKKKK